MMPSGFLYGPERDALVRQAKAVFNCHYYEAGRFEQARAFVCLSLGTPVISERTPHAVPPAAFEDSVFWIRREETREFFEAEFGAPAYFAQAREKLDGFRHHDVLGPYAQALSFAEQSRRTSSRRQAASPWRPTHIQIGSDTDYRPGWLNISTVERMQPDVVLDLAKPLQWPLCIDGPTTGPVELHAGSAREICANNALEHVSDLVQLMSNCLSLLQEGGEFRIEVPYERSVSAWQDPTHVRAMNENSWLYYTDWFWCLGWFEARFALRKLAYLDVNLQVCEREAAHFMRVHLVKVATTTAEKMTARTLQPDFGGVPDDLEPAP
jgi:hypothetical protein